MTQRRKLGAGAGDIALSADDVAALDALFPLGAAAGTRYPEESMRLLNTP